MSYLKGYPTTYVLASRTYLRRHIYTILGGKRGRKLLLERIVVQVFLSVDYSQMTCLPCLHWLQFEVLHSWLSWVAGVRREFVVGLRRWGNSIWQKFPGFWSILSPQVHILTHPAFFHFLASETHFQQVARTKRGKSDRQSAHFDFFLIFPGKALHCASLKKKRAISPLVISGKLSKVCCILALFGLWDPFPAGSPHRKRKKWPQKCPLWFFGIFPWKALHCKKKKANS